MMIVPSAPVDRVRAIFHRNCEIIDRLWDAADGLDLMIRPLAGHQLQPHLDRITKGDGKP